MPGKYALVIGNTEYIDSGLAKLNAPGKDAEDFARVLQSAEIAVFDEVVSFVNEDVFNLHMAIEDFFSGKTPDDLLVFYFSGHGVRDESGSLFLAVKNTNRARLHSTAITADFVRKLMDRSRSRRQVIILDCCNSGAFAYGAKAEAGGTMGIATTFEGTGYGRVVLTATDSTQFAWEGDKIIGDETVNSLFTHFLVKGLEGAADEDGDGKITVDDLYDYAYEQIVSRTPKQTPSKWSYKQQGEIILRQSTRVEDIKPIPLPADLANAIDNSITFVRKGAVQQLEELLKGRNIGLAHSAKKALEQIAKQDDSHVVAQLAAQALASVYQTEIAKGESEEERKAKEEAECLVAQKAEKEQLAREKVEREKIERDTKEKVEREAKEKLASEKAERNAVQKAEREKMEYEAKEKLARENAERDAVQKVKREKAEKAARELKVEPVVAKPEIKKTQKIPMWGIGLLAIVVISLGSWGVIRFSSGNLILSPTQNSVTTESTIGPIATIVIDPAEVTVKPIFAASGHADAAAEAFVHWDDTTANPDGIPTVCAKCHSEAGFVDFIADGKVDAAVPAPGVAFTCTMCHNDAADALTSVTFPSGAVIENLGPEARCLTCHQGRESKVSLDGKFAKFGENLDPDAVPAPYKDYAGKDVVLGFSNVHYFAAGGTLYGGQVKMGYEYEGKLYDAKNQHVDGFNTCLGCHDQHSLEVKVEACSECHEGVAAVEDLKNIREPSSAQDYDGDGDAAEGVAFEIAGLQEILYPAIQAYAAEVAGTPIVYDAATNPYWFVADADGKIALDDKGANVRYNAFTVRLMKATYNYQVSVKDPGAFAHGGKYIIELLVDSIEDINASEKLTTKFDATTLTREDTGHFNGARETWRNWDVDADGNPVYTVEAACAKCHSASGLPMVLAGETIPEAGVPAGNGLMCLTCHDGANFPALIAGNEVTMPSGKVVSFGEGAASNLCIECHQGRASKVTVDEKIALFPGAADAPDTVVAAIKDANDKDVKFSFINAHYLGIAAVWFGTDAQGFYEYEGKTYNGANTHAEVDGKAGCVGCHDVHTGTPKEEACVACHGTVAVDDIRGMSSTGDYNGNGDVTEGIRSEYRALRDVLYTEIKTYAKTTAGTGITYNTDVYPYWFVDADGDDKADVVDGKTVAYSTWTPRLLKAAFNFNFVRKNPGAGVHGGKYVIQVIFDSIEDLGGDVTKFVRP